MTGGPVASLLDVFILKSGDFGPPGDPSGSTRPLPYRADHLSASGVRLRWSDAASRAPWSTPPVRRLVRRLERAGAPFLQTALSLHHIAASDAVLAMFESEGTFLAWARRVRFPLSRRPPLAVVSCWLADLLPRFSHAKRSWYRKTYATVDRLFFFSSNQEAIFAEHLGLSPERLCFVPFGVDDEFFKPQEVPEGDFVLVVGRDRGRDWVSTFAAARTVGAPVKVLCRPADISGLAVPPNVDVLGFVDREQYRELLSRARTVVVASRPVAYPSGQSVTLEAMASGRCCVVTGTPALSDYLLPGQNAVVVPTGDHEALAAAIVETLADDALRRRIGAYARQVVEEGFTAAHMWDAIGTELRCISSRGRGGVSA